MINFFEPPPLLLTMVEQNLKEELSIKIETHSLGSEEIPETPQLNKARSGKV
jgi:hypothetical protein